MKHDEKEEYVIFDVQREGGWCKSLVGGCGSHFGVVSGKGSEIFCSLCSRRRFPPLWELSVYLRAILGVDTKSGGTACFHVLMMDGEAFSFVKK